VYFRHGCRRGGSLATFVGIYFWRFSSGQLAFSASLPSLPPSSRHRYPASVAPVWEEMGRYCRGDGVAVRLSALAGPEAPGSAAACRIERVARSRLYDDRRGWTWFCPA
jgi:hypothetical protein